MGVSQIVVGFDGSPASRAALVWAAEETARRHGELTVLHVFDWRVVGARAPIGGPYAADARARAEAVVATAMADARTVAPDVTIRGEAVLGSPGPTLVAVSTDADLVVVGSRGRGGFASLLLGSVSQQVATHAHAPVAVVRGRADITGGPVVAGVDGSEAADHAVGIAFEEASARGTGVVAVRAYTPAAVPWGPGGAPYVENPKERRDAEVAALESDIAAWRDKFPGVPVETIVVDGHVAEVLTGVSGRAQLVVVGTRGHGGFTGLLLGSVSLQVLHHADCPVLVARPAS